MHRGLTGRYEETRVGGEPVRAFIPNPLPPEPPLQMDGPLQQMLEQATLAVGRLDAVTSLLPDPDIFVYSYVRKEAVLSGHIEGTQSTLSDLLLFELGEMPAVARDDVTEVSNYVSAMEYGLERLAGGFPLSNRLIREMHGQLLSSGRGSRERPGEFRVSQNWIGGTRPGNARYVPPPSHAVQDCMGSLELFLHESDDGLPILARAGLAHAQFETIHPFLDGNGRMGRLVIALLLADRGVLSRPLLYISLFLREHRDEYFELLGQLRDGGDWEAWLTFFLTGVRITAEDAIQTAEHLSKLFQEDRRRLERQAGRRTSSALRVFDVLRDRLVIDLPTARDLTSLSYPTVSAAIQLLEELGIAQELTGKASYRRYVYREYAALLRGDE